MRRVLPVLLLGLIAAAPVAAADLCRGAAPAADVGALPAVWARMPVLAVDRRGPSTAYVLAVDSLASARLLRARAGESLAGELVERDGRIELVCDPPPATIAARHAAAEHR